MYENFDIDPLMGKKVKDKVTGFTGIVTGIIDHLYGCRQIVITAPVENNAKAKDNQAVIDEGRIKILGKGIRPKEVKSKSGKNGAGDIPSSIGISL